MKFPLPSNLTSVKDILLYPNTVTDGWFWVLILFGWFLLGVLRGFFSDDTGDFGRILTNAGLATALMGVLVWSFGGISTFIAVFLWLLYAGSAALSRGGKA